MTVKNLSVFCCLVVLFDLVVFRVSKRLKLIQKTTHKKFRCQNAFSVGMCLLISNKKDTALLLSPGRFARPALRAQNENVEENIDDISPN